MAFEISIQIQPEEIPVRGNCMVTQDPEADRACEDEILARLDRGDGWAWCCVCVTVSCAGLSVSDYLGTCSYLDQDDFRASGYYDDMVSECKTRLIASARAVLAAAGEG